MCKKKPLENTKTCFGRNHSYLRTKNEAYAL